MLSFRTTPGFTAGVFRQDLNSNYHEILLEENGLLERDGIHLTKSDKSVFASLLADPVRRVSREVYQGMMTTDC